MGQGSFLAPPASSLCSAPAVSSLLSSSLSSHHPHLSLLPFCLLCFSRNKPLTSFFFFFAWGLSIWKSALQGTFSSGGKQASGVGGSAMQSSRRARPRASACPCPSQRGLPLRLVLILVPLEGARVPERGALAPEGCLPQTGRGCGQLASFSPSLTLRSLLWKMWELA